MGFFDSIKKAIGGAANQVANQVQPGQQPMNAAPPMQHQPEPEPEEAHEEEASFDVAGFDPNDEDAFFNAILNVESAGEKMGATDESPEQVWARYGVRDHSHWMVVRDSMYHLLGQKYGSMETVMQRESNFRQGQVQRHMQNRVAAAAKSGELNPVEGVTLEMWAATNAAIVQGASLDDLLKGAGIDRARWDRAKTEWEARMARDTTFAIAQVYGAAFQNASKGKYSDYAKEANAARAANRDVGMQPPMSYDQYFDIMYEQSAASNQGKDAAEALKAMGLSIVDWCDLSTFMGYHLHRTWAHNIKQYQAAIENAKKRCDAKYPGVKTDVDIAF